MNMETSQTQPKKLQRLTKKQRGFVEHYVATGNASEAVKKNYNVSNDLTARVMGSENLTKPNVAQAIEIKQTSLKSALEKQGITPEKIAERIDILLHASKPIYKNNNSTGEIEQVGEEIDYTAVDKGLKHATNIYGVIDPDDKPKQTNTTYNFIFSNEVQDKVKEINETIKEKLINATPIETSVETEQ